VGEKEDKRKSKWLTLWTDKEERDDTRTIREYSQIGFTGRDIQLFRVERDQGNRRR
jgi:hypothetical protein